MRQLIVMLVCGLMGGTALSGTALGQGAAPIRKSVSAYALTSANDFQQRDPQDWRLLASNDGGSNWVTLDQRSGEVFSDRHQRLLFKLANTNAYNSYRLQIDRIRDVSGNSVQLAELELFGAEGEGSDLAPVFTDRISARGDNPPMESVARLFDHQAETKWLDRPPNQTRYSSWIQWQYESPGNTVLTNIHQLVELRSRAADRYLVRFGGVTVRHDLKRGMLQVIDETGTLLINGVSSLTELLPGQRLVIQGVSGWRDGKVNVENCEIIPEGANPSEKPRLISLGQSFLSGEDFLWVETEGTIQFQHDLQDEISCNLEAGEQSLPVRILKQNLSTPLPQSGSRVRVQGICRGGFSAGGQWMASSLWASSLKPVATGADLLTDQNPSVSSNGVPGFTTIREIRQLDRNVLQSQRHVKIRGVITGLLGMYIQDASAGIQVAINPSLSRGLTRLGDYVELDGWAGMSDAKTPVISVDKILRRAKGKLPMSQRPSWGQLVSGQMDSQWIEMEGVVRATDGAHLLLNCDGRPVTASINAGSVQVVKELVDAAVRLRGVGLAALDDWGRVQGVHLLIPSLEFVDVQQPAPKPFSQPIQPIGSILQLSRPEEYLHQVCIEGVLALQDGKKLFIQDATGHAMAIFKDEVVLDARFGRSRWSFWQMPATNTPLSSKLRFQPGDRVQVVGFRDTHGYSPVLTEASARKVGSGELRIETINTNAFTDWKRDSALVRLEALLLARETLGAEIVLELLWNGKTLQARMPRDGGDIDIAPGSRLGVTGIWQVDPVPYAELGRRVASVRILSRSPADLVVLSRPSWWTVEHALAVIGGLVFVLLAASIWITQLHRKVEQRSVQLSTEIHRREQIDHQRALQEERARIAQDLHDDLGAALTQIRFLSAVESRDAAVPEGTRAQLRKVSEKSHHLVASLDEIVWAINPANDSVPKLANYLTHVSEEFFSTTSIRCRLDIGESFPAVTLSSEVRHNLYLAFREALNNVAKHSGATEVWVRFKWEADSLHLLIEDNGRGFVQEASPVGEGLLNMRRRLEKIGGRFESLSQTGIGTTCRIWLPLKQETKCFPATSESHPF
jgi:signal transduction histidine kinase